MGIQLIKRGSHKSDVAKMRAIIERNGRVVLAADRGSGPDLVVLTGAGKRVAIEVERTLKGAAKYKKKLKEYWDLLLIGELDAVLYLCPNVAGVVLLRRLFQRHGLNSMTRVTVATYGLVYEL